MMIADRQNREKPVPKRRIKEKIIKVVEKTDSNQYEDEEEDDGDDSDKNKEKDSINDTIAETNEALTVNKCYW